MDPLRELSLLLRPAGGGIYVVSTGRAEQQALQKRLYGVDSEQEVQARFERALEAISGARVVLLAIPSDVGAGFLRGANMGPQGIRTALVEADPDWPARAAAAGVVDLGDVFVVPQLLHDEMLSAEQRRATARALYPQLPESEAFQLPVSPLSIAERALDLVFKLNAGAAPFLIGGDHSCAWPAVAALARVQKPGSWGIVQPDAHTDLLEERLGVKYCFATWSYHANQLLGRGGRLVQVGTRASRRDREHWEKTLDVRQFWADECRANPRQALDELIAHLHSRGVRGVYFSNDIDGTDDAYADATGTPEPRGLEPEFVVELIRRLGREFIMLGGDVMEVAPPIPRKPGGSERTVALAVRYMRETLAAILGSPV